MPKKHPDDAAAIHYRIKSPQIWAAIRIEWEAGASPAELARRFDVAATTIHRRRDREGWVRSPPLSTIGVAPGATDALSIARAALARSVEALSAGRAHDALAMIKAGDAVGAFADFVSRLEENAAVRRGPTPVPPARPEIAPGAESAEP